LLVQPVSLAFCAAQLEDIASGSRIKPDKTIETYRRLLPCFGFARPLYRGQIGKVFEQHPVDEDVAAAKAPLAIRETGPRRLHRPQHL
jgi:hypothetical protein